MPSGKPFTPPNRQKTANPGDFFDPNCRMIHGIGNIAAFKVRKTFFDDTPHVDVATVLGSQNYGEAVEKAREVRASGHNGWAVIDTVHGCACRVAG